MSNQKLNHSQESISYIQEEVTYSNLTDGITIAGTLTMPKSGDNFQFLRKGYFSVDSLSDEKCKVFNRTVSLRDTWARITKDK